MECLYCGGNTRVTNSRRQKRNNQIWRRRLCLNCGALFTSHESFELESALSVGVNGQLKPFNPDLLHKELVSCLKDRQDAPVAARELVSTVVAKLLKLPQKPVFSPKVISEATSEALKRFDKPAYLRYLADHPS